MLVALVSLTVGLVWLCRAYKSDRERPWLLIVLPVAVGLVLLTVPWLDRIAFVLAGHLVDWTRTAAEKVAPFLLLAVFVIALWWLARRWWRRYPALGPPGRGRILLLSTSIGLCIAAVLRVAPYLPDAARVAGEGARAGWNAGFDRAVDEAGEHLNGGEVP